MVLLALVWIAILTIALVEFGNYLWKQRRATRLAVEREAVDERSDATSEDFVKVPLRIIDVPKMVASDVLDDNQDENRTMLPRISVSDLDSESGIDD